MIMPTCFFSMWGVFGCLIHGELGRQDLDSLDSLAWRHAAWPGRKGW